MNEYQDEHSRTLHWILSLPGVPRPLIAALFALCWFCLWLGYYLESLTNPGQVWWLSVWNGSFGGNGFAAFGATVLALTITAEVGFMVFSLGAYLRQKESAKRAVEEARERALERGLEQGLEQGLERGLEQGLEQGREQGLEQGLEQGRETERQEWTKWLESVKPDLEAGRPPSVPPPTERNGTESPRD